MKASQALDEGSIPSIRSTMSAKRDAPSMTACVSGIVFYGLALCVTGMCVFNIGLT
jgi:hypothetical protein